MSHIQAQSRVDAIYKQIDSGISSGTLSVISLNGTSADTKQSITVIDNRTGNKYDIPIKDNTINAPPFLKMTKGGVKGLRLYDPGFMNKRKPKPKMGQNLVCGNKYFLLVPALPCPAPRYTGFVCTHTTHIP